MKTIFLTLILAVFSSLAATPAWSSSISSYDFGKGDSYGRHDDDNRFTSDRRNDKNDNRGAKDFVGYENNGSDYKLCDPKDNRWSDDRGREQGADKISDSWSFTSEHAHDHDNHDRPNISYPAYLPWPKPDNDHHGYDHRIGGDDRDDEDHKKLVNYYRDICDHNKDHDYAPSRVCDPKDPGAAPLPDAMVLFASALALLVFFGFKRQKPNRTI